MFSIFLDLKNEKNSKIVYGGLPSQFLHKEITYFKNYEKKYNAKSGHYKSDHWMLAIDSVSFGGSKIKSSVKKVILDTGCTLH